MNEEQITKLNNSNGYFVYLIPNEDAIDGDKLEYFVHLHPLEKPIVKWFQDVWNTPQENREKFIDNNLNIAQYNTTVLGLWTVIDEEFIESLPPPEVKDTYSLFRFIKENLSVEGPINLNNYSISAVTNGEFDCAYAFFIEDALDEKDGLGPILSSYVKKDGNGVVSLTKSTDLLTGYLM